MNDLNSARAAVNAPYFNGPSAMDLIASGSISAPKINSAAQISTTMGNIVTLNTHTSYSFNVEHDQAILKVEVPGKEQAEIEVYTVGQILHIESKPNVKLKVALAEGEVPQAPTLHLGVLTLVIDRPNKRQNIEFA